ncbi:uncharacterized protein LOC131858100 [Cryptomeria japonica]|uniref:uncharacterized protein LOC131858100 n=1 Tax=Cryptomeria japonica TaxID=3369 RepID=UPI0027DA72FE|nr:uncharacterized protein LOC131858100 [Cryptomeria japonica]
MHSKRDNLRSKLTKDLRYPHPAWITDQVTWEELTKDAKFKRKVHYFQKEASEDDLKYALLHGSQGLRQHMLDQGEKLVSGHESEEAQQSNSSGSEHEEELEDHDELFVAHNDSTIIPETREETILEFQQVGDNNIEEGVQCDEQSTPTIKKVPRRKRTKSKKMDRNK